jgi:predicted ATPase
MKIQLRNFGPIEFFEFDTKTQMHFIFGENNIGKSYAISAVYLILKNFSQFNFGNTMLLISEKEINSIKTFVSEKSDTNSVIDISEQLLPIFQSFFPKIILSNINNSFATSFDSVENLSNLYSNKPLSIHLIDEFMELVICVGKKNILELKEVKIKFNTIINIVSTNRSPKFYQSKKNLLFYFNKKNSSIEFFHDGIGEVFKDRFANLLKEVGNVYFLPASRSGLYNALSAFGAIFAELSQSRTFLRSKIELPNIAEPVSDYFLNLSSIKSNGKENSNLFSIANKIETNILKGEVLFNSKTKKLSYSPNKLDINLDLSFTSSMISEIAPIVAHLKYIVKEKKISPSLLFIEEPEAHLHPKIQVELMKLFVNLSKSGVKVIVTSHSNYLFNKLSNLILAKEIDMDSVEVYHFKMGENGSYVDKNSMKIDVEGIEDANFSEIAEELYAERLGLYENLEL